MDKIQASSLLDSLKLVGTDWEAMADAIADLIPISDTGVSIDGGGILGVGPAAFMAALGYMGESWLSGTSTGAIIVALRGVGYSWEEILNMFLSDGPKMFADPGFLWNANPFLPKYDEANLEKALKRYFGSRTLKDFRVPVFVTASDFRTGKPKVFDSLTDTDIPIWYAVRCSTAAPTYFSPVGGRYADGGLWANNPILVGVAGYSSKAGVNPLRCRTISLGTSGGHWTPISIGRNMSKLQWAEPIIEYAIQGTGEAPEFIANQLLGPRRHMRISPTLTTGYSLDAVRAMKDYRGIWERLEHTMHHDLWAWLLK